MKVIQIPIAEAITLFFARDFDDIVSQIAVEPFSRGYFFAENKIWRSEYCTASFLVPKDGANTTLFLKLYLPLPHPQVLSKYLQRNNEDEKRGPNNGGLDPQTFLRTFSFSPSDLEIRNDESADGPPSIDPRRDLPWSLRV